MICATGTGCTGWARSTVAQRRESPPLPAPEQPRLVWFVREPFPSVATGTKPNAGVIQVGTALEMVPEMGRDGVLFADGIEQDRIEFLSGQRVRLTLSQITLNLVVPETSSTAVPDPRAAEVRRQFLRTMQRSRTTRNRPGNPPK